MQTRSCSQCGRPADFSLQFLLSTVRRTPRKQKCTKSVLFCKSCIQVVSERITSVAPSDLIQPLISAYTNIARHSNEQSDSTSAHNSDEKSATVGAGPSLPDAPEASCRPCLIACNSRQIDEVAATTTGLKGVGRE